MAKVKDPTPIPVIRTNKTSRIEIFLNPADDSLQNVIAHRWTYTTQAGVQVLAPIYIGTITLLPSEVSPALQNQISNLEALIDGKDL